MDNYSRQFDTRVEKVNKSDISLPDTVGELQILNFIFAETFEYLIDYK